MFGATGTAITVNDLRSAPSRAHLERNLASLWGRRVARVRRCRSLSQTALGVRCAVTQQTISKVERGEVLPGDGLKLALADALGVLPGDLFAWPPEPGGPVHAGSVAGGLTDRR